MTTKTLQLFQDNETQEHFVETELDEMSIDEWYLNQLPKILKLKDFRTEVKVATLLNEKNGWNLTIVKPLLEKEGLLPKDVVTPESSEPSETSNEETDEKKEDTINEDRSVMPEPVVDKRILTRESLKVSFGATGKITYSTTDKFYCSLKTIYSKDKRDVFFVEDVPKIGEFKNRKQFIYRLNELYDEYASKFSVVKQPPYEIRKFGKNEFKFTTEEAAGFNISKYVDDLKRPTGPTIEQAELRKRYSASYDNNGDAYRKIRSKFTCAVRDHELEFHKQRDAEITKYFIKPDKIRKYVKTFMTDYQTYYPDLARKQYDERRDRIIREMPDFKYINHLMPRMRPIMQYFFNVIKQILQGTLKIDDIEADKLYDALADIIKINVLRFGGTNRVPARIVRHKASDFLIGFITTLLFGKYCELKYISGNTGSIETLLDIIVLKSIMPIWMFSVEEINKMDNIIYKNLICNLKAYNGPKNTIECDYNHDRNFLSEAFAASWSRGGNLKAIFSNFLHTNIATGKGWGGAGNSKIVPIPTGFDGFFNRDKVLYAHPYGIEIPSERTIYPQLNNLHDFLNEMTDRKMFKDRFTDSSEFIALCNKLNNRIMDLANAAYLIEKALRKFSTTPFCYPSDHRSWKREMTTKRNPALVDKIKVEMVMGQPTAYALMLVISDFETLAYQFETLDAAWNLANWAREVHEKYYDGVDIVKAHPEVIFLPKEKEAIYFSTKGRHYKSPFDSNLIETYSQQKNFDKIFMKMSFRERLRKRSLKPFKAFVQQNKKHFGWVEKFYITHKPEDVAKRPFSKLYARRTQKIIATYDEQGLVHARDTGELTKMMERVYMLEGCIRIDTPIRIEIKEFGYQPTFSQELPFDFPGETLNMKTLTVHYQIFDHIKDNIPYGIYRPSYPQVVIDEEDVPIIYGEKNKPLGLYKSTNCFNVNLRIIDDTDFYSKKFAIVPKL